LPSSLFAALLTSARGLNGVSINGFLRLCIVVGNLNVGGVTLDRFFCFAGVVTSKELSRRRASSCNCLFSFIVCLTSWRSSSSDIFDRSSVSAAAMLGQGSTCIKVIHSPFAHMRSSWCHLKWKKIRKKECGLFHTNHNRHTQFLFCTSIQTSGTSPTYSTFGTRAVLILVPRGTSLLGTTWVQTSARTFTLGTKQCVLTTQTAQQALSSLNGVVCLRRPTRWGVIKPTPPFDVFFTSMCPKTRLRGETGDVP
jgi:hypothetical protein